MTQRPHHDPSASGAKVSEDAEEFLDRVFDEVVASLEAGRALDARALVEQRPGLRGAIEEVIALARQVAAVRPSGFPSVPGYRIVAEIGRGAMGEVFVAHQERASGRLVALKILPTDAASSPRARERFRVESAAIARLGHPNIVRIFDVIEVDGVLAHSMQLVDGRTLADHIRERSGVGQSGVGRPARRAPRLDPAWACRIGVAIARALSAVHAAGLLHRDVKPSNILVGSDGVPLLTDFGLVRDLSSQLRTEPGQFVGTPAYAAPEQLRAGDVGPRADVYGLGATLFHAITGTLPWPGSTTAEILRQMEDATAPRLRAGAPRCSRDLETVIGKAMELDPARRYQTADDLADDLQRILDHRPIVARPPGVLRRALLAARRNRRALAGATAGSAAAMLLALAAVAWWVVLPARSRAEIRLARIALLDPSESDAWFAGAHLGERGLVPRLADPGLLRATAHYRRAASYHRLTVLERIEVHAIAMAAEIRSGQPPTVPAWLDRTAPAAASYARSWTLSGPPPLERVIQPADPLDRRALGLIAALCGDLVVGIDAWEGLPIEQNPDPLVEAALAQYCLATDQDARALAYAAAAYRDFGDVGFMCVKYADGAVRCGDLDLGERLLARARTLDGHDGFNTLERVEADLKAARAEGLRAEGRNAEADALDAEARTQYEFYRTNRINGSARDRYGRFLAARGDLREAAEVYAEIVRLYPTVPMYREKFRDAADRWWASLGPSQRMGELRALLDGDPVLFEILFLTAGGLGPPLDTNPRPTPAPPRGPDAYVAWVGLPELAARLRVLDLDRWGRAHCYPPLLREALVSLWSTPVPAWWADIAIGVWRARTGDGLPPLGATYNQGFESAMEADDLYFATYPGGSAAIENGALHLRLEAGNLARNHRAAVFTRFAIDGDFELTCREVPTTGPGGWQVMALITPLGNVTARSGIMDSPGSGISLRDRRILFARGTPGEAFDRVRIRRRGRLILVDHANADGPWSLTNIAYDRLALAPTRGGLILNAITPVDTPRTGAFDDWEIRAERLLPEDHLPAGLAPWPR